MQGPSFITASLAMGIIQLGTMQTEEEVISSFKSHMDANAEGKIKMKCSYLDQGTLTYDPIDKVLQVSRLSPEKVDSLRNKMVLNGLNIEKTKIKKYKIPVCVAVIISQEDKILLLQRKNTGWMDGFWGMPGGALEANESIAEAAARESKEEVGIQINPADLELVHTMHVRRANNNEILLYMFSACVWSGTPQNGEPHKCSDVKWFDIKCLPSNFIPQTLYAYMQAKKGNHYSEQTSYE